MAHASREERPRSIELCGSCSVEGVRRRNRERCVPGQRSHLTQVEPERWVTVVVGDVDPLRPESGDAGCMADGETYGRAVANAQQALRGGSRWLGSARPVPESRGRLLVA